MSEPTQQAIHLRVSHARATRWIRDELELGRKLKIESGFWGVSNAHVAAAVRAGDEWLDRVRQMLHRIFDTSATVDDQWRDASFARAVSAKDAYRQEKQFNAYRDSCLARLDYVLKRARYFEEVLPGQASPQATTAAGAEYEIYIVHGHDTPARESVARYLTELGLQPIILDEQPDASHTVIEKLESSYEEIDYAVILMTPDDVGALITDAEHLKPRARQNVVLELGFAMGVLGRDRVCALHSEGLELPSDYNGVVYISLDTAGAWKLKLGKELRKAGIDVDLNRVV